MARTLTFPARAGRFDRPIVGIAAGLARLALAWRRRRRLARMRDLNDHMLDDIGVTRAELEQAMGLPFESNAALDLDRWARARRTRERRR